MESRYKFVLTPLGSAGDVHPHIWIGKLLAARGHEVVMVCQSVVGEIPERAGIRYVPWGDKVEQEALLQNADIWHPSKAFVLLMSFMPQWAAESRPLIEAEIASASPDRPAVIVSGTLALGAKIASEKTGVPLLDLHLQPSMFMSVDETPVMMAGLGIVPRLPRWMRQVIVTLGSWRVDGVLRPLVKKVREDAGLPAPHPKKNLMDYCWHPKDGEIALFPDWYAPKAADWPAGTATTRFPLYDESTDRPIDPELEAFLEAGGAGSAPVMITPGSANAHAAEFIRESVAACQRIGRRALVITRFPEQAGGAMPAGSACFKYVPFGRAFPRAAAVVHHGGIGTMAQCMVAGVPQLVMPMAHDQPDNANRIKRFGIGDYLYPKKFKAGRIAEKLKGLIGVPAVESACAEIQRLMRTQMSMEEVAEIIEGMAEKALRARGRAGVASGV